MTAISFGWRTPSRAGSAMRWWSWRSRMRSWMNWSETAAASSWPCCAADQLQHQVERRRAARAGEAVAVDLEQLRGHLDLRELLAEAGEVLPVDGAAIAVEQAGARQDVAAGADRTDIRALPVEPPQPGEDGAVLDRDARRCRCRRRPSRAADLVDRRPRAPPRCRCRRSPVCRPCENRCQRIERPPARAIGAAQRLDRRGEARSWRSSAPAGTA